MDFLVSSSIPDKVDLCTTVWDGESPLTARVEYIPRHIRLNVGDTLVTSGFGGIYPKGVLIGKILESKLEENEAFHNVTIELATEFSQLSFVQIIQNRLKVEKDSLELQVAP
jgi:rod shape-determining protein MreC